MLFEQSIEEFSNERFRDPAACYRGAPFWSWNTLMTKEMIERQILDFKQMGMGEFHVHVRVGLKNQYMSDEFLELVQFCCEKAKENGMLCWLYDEDRYSSGIAGGEVTKRIYYRARWLKLTVQRQQGMLDSYEEFLEKQGRNEKVKGCFLRAYDIVLRSGYLESVRIIDKDEAPKGVKWYLYIELAEESAWCNGQTYVDTMKKEAIGSFIHLTHDRYFRKFIVWNRKGETASPFRYRYYRTISELFADAYCGQVGDWCEKHRLLSTGHLLGEDSMRGQASSVGDAMRCYREFQLPGIDNLCDNRDFLAAKQAASAAHQFKKEGVLSELYGVTQWDFDFEGYKLAGDWQAALGVTVRVPHLAWASMNGIDFDYIGESSLENKSSLADDGLFHCGAMGYSVVLVPSCIDLRSTTIRDVRMRCGAEGRCTRRRSLT